MLEFFTTIDDFVWGPPSGPSCRNWLPYNSSWSLQFFVFLKLLNLSLLNKEGDISGFAARLLSQQLLVQVTLSVKRR